MLKDEISVSFLRRSAGWFTSGVNVCHGADPHRRRDPNLSQTFPLLLHIPIYSYIIILFQYIELEFDIKIIDKSGFASRL